MTLKKILNGINFSIISFKNKFFIIMFLFSLCCIVLKLYFEKKQTPINTQQNILFFDNLHPLQKQCNELYKKALLYIKNNEFEEAYKKLIYIFYILEKHGKKEDVARISLKIHEISLMKKNEEVHKKIYTLDQCEIILNNTNYIDEVYLVSSMFYINKSKIKKAKHYLNKVLKKNEESYLRIKAFESLSYCHWIMGNNKASFDIIKYVLSRYKKEDILKNFNLFFKIYIIHFIENFNFEEAHRKLDIAIDFFTKEGDSYQKNAFSQLKAYVYVKEGCFKNALSLLRELDKEIKIIGNNKLYHIGNLIKLCAYTGIDDNESYNKVYTESFHKENYVVDKNIITFLILELIRIKIQKGRFNEIPFYLTKIATFTENDEVSKLKFLSYFYSALFHFFIKSGRFEKFVIDAANISNMIDNSHINAQSYMLLSLMDYNQHHIKTSTIYINKALDCIKGSEDFGLIGHLFMIKGKIYLFQGACEESINCFNNAIENFQRIGRKRYIAEANLYLGLINFFYGNIKKAFFYCDEVISGGKEANMYKSHAYRIKSSVYLHQGDHKKVKSCIQKSYHHAQKENNLKDMVSSLILLANYYIRECSLSSAEKIINECLDAIVNIEDKALECELYITQGLYFLRKNDRQKIEKKFNDAISIAQDIDYKWAEVKSLYHLANYYISISRFKEAKYMLDQSQVIAECSQYKIMIGLIKSAKGHVLLNNKEEKKALSLFNEVIDIGVKTKSGILIADGNYGLFIYNLFLGNNKKAEEYSNIAIMYYKNAGDLLNCIKTERRLSVINFGKDYRSRDSLMSIYKIICDKGIECLKVKTLLSLAELEIDYSSYEEAEKYIIKVLSSIKKSEFDIKSKIHAYRLYAHIERERENYKQAEIWAEKAIMLSKKIGCKKDIVFSFYCFAKIKFKNGEYDSAIQFLKSIERDFLIKRKDHFNRGRIYFLLGRAYLKLNNLEKSLEYFIKAKKLFFYISNYFYEKKSELQIIKIKNKIKEQNLSENIIKDYIQSVDEFFDNKDLTVLGYLELSYFLERNDKNDEALKIYENMLKMTEKITISMKIHIYYKFACYCLRKKRFNVAKNLIKDAIYIAKENGLYRYYNQKLKKLNDN